MNQNGDFQNRKLAIENRKSAHGPMARSFDGSISRAGNPIGGLSVQAYEVLQARQQVAMRRIRTIKQRMDVQQQSGLGKSARRIFPQGEIAEPSGPYTRALAVELAYKGIRVNAIAPGWVTVENYYKAVPGFSEEQAAETASRMIPAARTGTPLEIARLAAFLCSEDAGYIVGQTVVADGGTSALMSLISDFRTESTNRFGKGYVPGV